MERPQPINKILFPTDFSQSSIDAMQYAVRLSATLGAELIILHTFRLTDTHLEGKKLFDSKKNLEISAINEFNVFDDKYLKHTGIRYLFLSEVGFMSDRIISNIKEHKIDLLMLGNEMQTKMKEKTEVDCKGIIQGLGCPVLLVPELISSNLV
jgi:nucleotide-binding universal stress UspA family protein